MKPHAAFFLMCAFLGTGCSNRDFESSAYVLIRYSGTDESVPALRAYFSDEGAKLNGISCREVLQLVNEAVEARVEKGETYLVKYQCVSLQEARERGF